MGIQSEILQSKKKKKRKEKKNRIKKKIRKGRETVVGIFRRRLNAALHRADRGEYFTSF